jgi:polysaccharide biosynthesis transport protein
MENPPISGAGSADTKLHFLDYWRIIRIRKTVILAVFLLVVITTTAVTLLLPKAYSSMARIRVEKDVTDVSNLFERPNANTYDPFFLTTEFEVIQSEKVLTNVISSLGLSARWSKRYKDGSPLNVDEATFLLKRMIDVRQFRNTSLIEIRVLSEDAAEAAEIANEIAKAYKDTRLSVRNVYSEKGIEKYREQFKEQEVIVSNLQAQVDGLRSTLQVNESSPDSSMPAPTLEPETVRKLDTEKIQAETTYVRMNTTLEKLTNLSRVEQVQALPVSFQNDQELTDLMMKRNTAQQELTSLQENRGEKNPDVIRISALLKTINEQIDQKVSGVLQGLRVQVASLKAQADEVAKRLDEAKQKDVQNQAKYSPYYTLKRKLEGEKRMLEALNMKIKAELVEKELPRQSIVEITDGARPGMRPVRPNIPLNVALGLIVGLVVGIGLAFFIEYLDTSVKTIDDVERALQAPVPGVIPQNVGLLLDEGPDSTHAEAYRVLRTNLLFSRKEQQLNSITVISGGAAEGKSTTIFNLATIFAQSGQRVLVVDSDLRRPSLHKFLKVSNAVGLTNYLLRQKSLEEVIQTTNLPTLDFLPSGKLPSSAMGILNSTRMKEFIQEVGQRYEFVFFDSPPIMGVSDASVLASQVDMVLLVVQYRKYPQAMTVRAKQMVEKVGGNLLGVVLNNINISQDSYYYYYSGYYYDYYSKRDESGSGKADGETSKTGADAGKIEIKQKY